MSDCEWSKKQIISYTHALQWCNLLAKKTQSSLHWDCIPFFVKCNQSEKPVQRKTQNIKNNEKSHKREQEWHSRWTKPEATEKLEEHPICSLCKTLMISCACRQAKTKFGCVLSFLKNAATSRNLLCSQNKWLKQHLIKSLFHQESAMSLIILYIISPETIYPVQKSESI